MIETATKPRPGPGTRGGSAVTDGSAGNGAATRPHVFEVEGRLQAFDPVSGRFFRLDPVARDVLEYWPARSGDEIAALLADRHPAAAVRGAFAEIARQTESGLLAPVGVKPPDRPSPVPVEPRIVNLTLNVASGCNLRCVYCWNQGGAYGRATRQGRMEIPTALKAVDFMVRHSSPQDALLVDFYGGEPLLNFEVLRATMDYCRGLEKEKKCDRTFSFKVTTNGTLLTREMVEYFSQLDVSLGVSIDGRKVIHDRNRPYPDGSGTWETIRHNVGPALAAGNLNVSARATLAPPDLDMVAAIKGLYRLGFRDTSVEFASESAEAFVPSGGIRYTEHDTRRMQQQYLRFARFYLKHTLYRDEAIDVGLSNLVTRVLHESRRPSPCGAGNHVITVSEEGGLYPCIGFIGMPEYLLGHVDTGIDLGRLERFRHQMRSVVFEARECTNCWARSICAGNCPANNVQHNHDIYQPYGRGCDWLRFQLEVGMWLASEIAERKPERLEGYRPA